MGMTLNDEIRRLLDGRHFAVLATINPDGAPQTSAMWVGRDGDDVLMSTSPAVASTATWSATRARA